MKKLFIISLSLFITVASLAQKNNYRIVVKFGSMCCGVPSNKPLLNYVKAFKKQYKIKKITCDSIGPMGREGEYNMAFSLKELKQKQIEIFVKEVTTLVITMKDKGYATVEENVAIDGSTQNGRMKIITKTINL